MILDIIITSLINGSTYALLAIGFSLIFGVARIVNIAHTAFYMVAAYCIYFVTYNMGFHPIVGMLIAVPLVTLLGMVTYRIFIAPIREHEAAVLIGTIALAIALQEVMLLIFSGDYRSVPALMQGFFTIFGSQGLLSATDYTYRGPGHSRRTPAPAHADKAGTGHPINGPGPGGGQPHGNE